MVEDGDVEEAVEVTEGLLMPRAREAGGPTGTMRDPNSTPIVTSWCGEKRPSQRRMVSCVGQRRWSLGGENRATYAGFAAA